MSETKGVPGWLTATVLGAALLGCAVPEGPALQGGNVEAQRPATGIPRMEDLPPHEWATYGYTPPADAHDAQEPDTEVPRMEDLPPHEWATYGYTPPAR